MYDKYFNNMNYKIVHILTAKFMEHMKNKNNDDDNDNDAN